MKIWKWKTTKLDFEDYLQTYQDEGVVGFRGYGQRIIEAVFTKLGIPDTETHFWENGQYSCEYNQALEDAESIDLIEVYTPSKLFDEEAEGDGVVQYFIQRMIEFKELNDPAAMTYGKLNGIEIFWKAATTIQEASMDYFEEIGEDKLCVEWCSYCENEVEIPRIGYTKCPVCGNLLIPCSECHGYSCNTCPYKNPLMMKNFTSPFI